MNKQLIAVFLTLVFSHIACATQLVTSGRNNPIIPDQHSQSASTTNKTATAENLVKEKLGLNQEEKAKILAIIKDEEIKFKGLMENVPANP